MPSFTNAQHLDFLFIYFFYTKHIWLLLYIYVFLLRMRMIPHNIKNLCIQVSFESVRFGPVVYSQMGMYDYQTALTMVAVCVGALSYG